MSRSTVAKSRAEKGGKTTSAPTPAVTHEIVPGKFNDQDWNCMTDHDDGDEFMIDIVNDICTQALDIIHEKYLEKQLVPYTVQQAKDALLQIIEWQFLSRDEGEADVETDSGWIQDEEPQPAVTDCWAQGSVPKQIITKSPTPLPEVVEEAEQETQVEEETPADVPAVDDTEAPTEEVKETQDTEEPVVVEETIEDDSQNTSAKTEPESKTKRSKYKPHRGKLRSAGISKMTDSLEKMEMDLILSENSPSPIRSPDPNVLHMPSSCHSILRLQAGRPPGNRDVFYDDAGNVVGVTKINPSRLPSHRVRTGFQVVDPTVEAAQARLEAMRTGKFRKMPRPNQTKKSPRNATGMASLTGRTGVGESLSKSKESVKPLPPPLIETMEVAPGVIVREGDRVKKGPRQHPKKAGLIAAASHRGLRPVTLKGTVPFVAVQQLLEGQSPMIRPLQESPPIPPIMPHPPPSQMVWGQ